MSARDHALYAMRDGRGVHVSEVPQGVRCGCTCGVCNGPLVACKGWKYKHYFRHRALNGCPGGKGGPETALHRRAIEILATLDVVRLPRYELKLPKELQGAPESRDLGIVSSERNAPLCAVRTEPRLRGLCPDALVYEADGLPLLLEVVVTHDVDQAKLEKIREIGYAAVAIVLPRDNESLSPAELEVKLRDDIRCKRWMYHPGESAVALRIETALKRALSAAAKAIVNERRPVRRLGAAPARQISEAESISAMHTAIKSAGFAVPEEEMQAFRGRYWANFRRWPAIEEYRVHLYLMQKAASEKLT